MLLCPAINFYSCHLHNISTHIALCGHKICPHDIPDIDQPTFCTFFHCRRAQLRDCLEVLRQHVPLPDKLTTLALLQSARKYIEVYNV